MGYRSPYKIANGERFAPKEPQLYISAQIRQIGPGNRALFAAEPIAKGTILYRDGGVVVSSIADTNYKYAVLIEDGIWLAPPDYDKLDEFCFLNHSCDSNVGRTGGILYFAKKDIAVGEELTIDYAPLVSDHPDWTLRCECKAPACRKVITSVDYRDPKIAQALWFEWLPYVQRKIQAREMKIGEKRPNQASFFECPTLD